MQFICLHTIEMSNSSIWFIDRILSGTPSLGQNEPVSNGIVRILCILQSSSITGASLYQIP